MKKLLFLFLLIPFLGNAQVYQRMPQYGYNLDRLSADSVLKLPSDTTNNKSGIARIGTTLYAGNGSYWTAAGGGGSSYTAGNGIIIAPTVISADTGRNVAQLVTGGTLKKVIDSIGGGGSTPTLQQVLTAGNVLSGLDTIDLQSAGGQLWVTDGQGTAVQLTRALTESNSYGMGINSGTGSWIEFDIAGNTNLKSQVGGYLDIDYGSTTIEAPYFYLPHILSNPGTKSLRIDPASGYISYADTTSGVPDSSIIAGSHISISYSGTDRIISAVPDTIHYTDLIDSVLTYGLVDSINGLKDTLGGTALTAGVKDVFMNQTLSVKGNVGIGATTPTAKLEVWRGGNNLLSIDTSNSLISSWSNGDVHSTAYFQPVSNQSVSLFYIQNEYLLNNNSIVSRLDDVGTNNITYTAGTHIFNGDASVSGTSTLTGNVGIGGAVTDRNLELGVSNSVNSTFRQNIGDGDTSSFNIYNNATSSNLVRIDGGYSGAAKILFDETNQFGVNVGIGTATPTHKLEVVGDMSVSGTTTHTAMAFASLPASPVAGMVATVNNSTTQTWGATITGGGAFTVLAFYNGSAWTVMAK